jgi:class 3 adenylate cyclase
MRCDKCGAEGIPGKKFCAECGSPLSNRCSKCGSDCAPGARFCADCGAALGAPPAASAKKSDEPPIRVTETPAPETLEGERKTVTTLFADIKGSMELIEDLDPEEARALVDPALKLMIDAVHHYEGYVAQSTGDGIFALFGAPVAHEDHSQRSVEGALRVVFVRHRCAEQSEDAVTGGLRYVAAVALHRLHHQLECRVNDCSCFLGVEVLDQLHRALDIRKQHRDGLALALEVVRGGRACYSNLRLI